MLSTNCPRKYGGMENANLTTLTPALVAGDRSLTDVLAHELMHSWSGNLTSCSNWSHFWLNEGWTVYLERLLLNEIYGPEPGGEGAAHRGFSYIIGAKALNDALEQFKDQPKFQRLMPVFEGDQDPDDAFSSIPCESYVLSGLRCCSNRRSLERPRLTSPLDPHTHRREGQQLHPSHRGDDRRPGPLPAVR